MTKDAILDITNHAEPIGAFRNDWRQRTVRIYAHPTDPTLVLTVGIGRHGEVTPTCEPRERFVSYIGSFNKVYS